MNAFAQFWSALLPLRWYMAVLLGQAARGLPVQDSARPFTALAALATLYTLLAFLSMRRLGASLTGETIAPEPAAPDASRGVAGAFAAEWRRVLATRGAFVLLVLAPLVYGVYYPQPYLTQILRKIPIAVVDDDLSELSRRGLVLLLDFTRRCGCNRGDIMEPPLLGVTKRHDDCFLVTPDDAKPHKAAVSCGIKCPNPECGTAFQART